MRLCLTAVPFSTVPDLAELVAAYNRRIEVAIAEYLASRCRTNACVERLN